MSVVVDQNPSPVEDKDLSVEVKDETVAIDVHKKTISESMKWKEKFREMEASNAKLISDRESEKEAKLLEEGKDRERADHYKQKLDETLASQKAKDEASLAREQKVIDMQKSFELDKAVGGFVHSSYLKLDAVKDGLKEIEMDEHGKSVQASVLKVAERLKRDHSALIKQTVKQTLPNQAPGDTTPATFKETIKKVGTTAELDALLEKQKR